MSGLDRKMEKKIFFLFLKLLFIFILHHFCIRFHCLGGNTIRVRVSYREDRYWKMSGIGLHDMKSPKNQLKRKKTK